LKIFRQSSHEGFNPHQSPSEYATGLDCHITTCSANPGACSP